MNAKISSIFEFFDAWGDAISEGSQDHLSVLGNLNDPEALALCAMLTFSWGDHMAEKEKAAEVLVETALSGNKSAFRIIWLSCRMGNYFTLKAMRLGIKEKLYRDILMQMVEEHQLFIGEIAIESLREGGGLDYEPVRDFLGKVVHQEEQPEEVKKAAKQALETWQG